MSFLESIRQALDSLRANKLRSILTMIGIIMGVFSIITIMAIGNATEEYINSQFERIGANVLTIGYKNMSVESDELLYLEDVETVKNAAREIKNVTTYIQRSGTFRMDTKTRGALVYGTTAQYKDITPMEMAAGRFFTDFDVSSRLKVVVVDEYFAKRYFNKVDIVGEIVQFKSPTGNYKLKVIGVTKSTNDAMAGLLDNEDFPTQVYMPITTVQQMYYNNKTLDSIFVTLDQEEDYKEVGERIVRALEMTKGKRDIYMTYSTQDSQEILSSIIGVVSGVLLVIAVITLIVGGIGIVNILLVSVTERIREIGIRKALGAQKKDIIFQFITESIIMTGISGMIGIFLGVLGGNIISQIIQIPPVVDVPVIVGAFLGSVALGLIFGVYPAKKAADLDPIESLRYE
ncbi:ABC transporter permease [Acetivibrio mesophilus]|uniref:FtsX-like permease family protein n=1 Tax=Acetivibrio mesophilus TaxID=2487273 RepID=A0A4Q0I2V1_9FIRM|nr:ABC transporter permease [Acetivibrio mesophilus]ODM26548.1 macrolide export ATP-binding/permease MacB [Clostridium sp. Bc-iso-3]RXE58538.1 FtsX-like permease family protein [Acetivibrio mesophilus]HHV28047.1 FtsX-like permease family protein [Clostridium sp.]